jgi:DNA-binding transcriptional LysR family regulator
MLSLYKLEVFNAVAMEGSFSRAAERLLLSQPAVSQHIRDLEASLGRALFRRGNRGVTLTEAGELLLETTRNILRLLAEAESAIAALDDRARGPVAIGATPGAGVYLLPGWIQSFRKRFPEITPLLRTGTTAVIAAEVAGGRLDLAIIEGELFPEPPLRVQPLREIELRLVVGERHPLGSLAEAPLAALDGQAFIARPPGSHTRAWTDQLFSQNGISPQIVAVFDNPEGIIHAVAAGLGVSLLPDWVAPQPAEGSSVRLIPIQGLALQRTLKLLWAEDRLLRAPAQAFLAHLAELFPALEFSYQGSKQS